MAGGRPSAFTKEIADEICERLAAGETLIDICEDDHMPGRATVFRWMNDKKSPECQEFRDAYTQARIDQAQHWADEIVKIADDGRRDVIIDEETGQERVNHDHIQRSRLRVDTRKFLMAKIAPRLYGEKTSVEVSGPDGGAIQTEDVTTREIARRMAFALMTGAGPDPA